MQNCKLQNCKLAIATLAATEARGRVPAKLSHFATFAAFAVLPMFPTLHILRPAIARCDSPPSARPRARSLLSPLSLPLPRRAARNTAG